MIVRLAQLSLFLLGSVVLTGQSPATKSGIDVEGMDKSCKPCEDFYRYANGKFLDDNPIPARFSNWGSFGILAEANRERLKVILETAASSNASAGSNQRKIGDLYTSCMNTAEIDKRGYRPIEGQLKRVSSIKSRADLVSVLNELQVTGQVGTLSAAGIPDAKNPQLVILHLFSAGLSLPDRDYYFNDDEKTKNIRAEFLKHVARMLKLIGEGDAEAEAGAKTILEFETSLAKAHLTRVERRDPYNWYNKVGISGIRKLAPDYDWNGYLKTIRVEASEDIVVDAPKYLEEFNRLLTAAPLDTWKTWLRWRIVRAAATELSKPFHDEDFAFQQAVLLGVKEQKPRWQICSEMTDRALGDALGQLFVEKHFPPEAKRRMNELVENLRATLREELEAAEWLQPETKKAALEKLSAFRQKIGYPDRWRDYSDVKIGPATYFENVESAIIVNRRYRLGKIGKPVDRNDWAMTPPTVNAYYNALQTEIVFPAGILQPPFFSLDWDDAANYGAIGAVIGHEMGHGFDDQGSKYAADGSLRNWWTEEDRKKFQARTECIVEQFDTMEVGDGLPNHNGKLVTGEALGDLGGVTLAYKAYKRSLKGKEAPVLDGFTGDQRFFLAFGRIWARHFRPEAARLRIQTDPHPLDRWRAIGTLQNVPEFHKAFGCKPGDPMVRPPERQCKLW
jgi:predicted metalloendopeptidase